MLRCLLRIIGENHNLDPETTSGGGATSSEMALVILVNQWSSSSDASTGILFLSLGTINTLNMV